MRVRASVRARGHVTVPVPLVRRMLERSPELFLRVKRVCVCVCVCACVRARVCELCELCVCLAVFQHVHVQDRHVDRHELLINKDA